MSLNFGGALSTVLALQLLENWLDFRFMSWSWLISDFCGRKLAKAFISKRAC